MLHRFVGKKDHAKTFLCCLLSKRLLIRAHAQTHLVSFEEAGMFPVHHKLTSPRHFHVTTAAFETKRQALINSISSSFARSFPQTRKIGLSKSDVSPAFYLRLRRALRMPSSASVLVRAMAAVSQTARGSLKAREVSKAMLATVTFQQRDCVFDFLEYGPISAPKAEFKRAMQNRSAPDADRALQLVDCAVNATELVQALFGRANEPQNRSKRALYFQAKLEVERVEALCLQISLVTPREGFPSVISKGKLSAEKPKESGTGNSVSEPTDGLSSPRHIRGLLQSALAYAEKRRTQLIMEATNRQQNPTEPTVKGDDKSDALGGEFGLNSAGHEDINGNASMRRRKEMKRMLSKISSFCQKVDRKMSIKRERRRTIIAAMEHAEKERKKKKEKEMRQREKEQQMHSRRMTRRASMRERLAARRWGYIIKRLFDAIRSPNIPDLEEREEEVDKIQEEIQNVGDLIRDASAASSAGVASAVAALGSYQVIAQSHPVDEKPAPRVTTEHPNLEIPSDQLASKHPSALRERTPVASVKPVTNTAQKKSPLWVRRGNARAARLTSSGTKDGNRAKKKQKQVERSREQHADKALSPPSEHIIAFYSVLAGREGGFAHRHRVIREGKDSAAGLLLRIPSRPKPKYERLDLSRLF